MKMNGEPSSRLLLLPAQIFIWFRHHRLLQQPLNWLGSATLRRTIFNSRQKVLHMDHHSGLRTLNRSWRLGDHYFLLNSHEEILEACKLIQISWGNPRSFWSPHCKPYVIGAAFAEAQQAIEINPYNSMVFFVGSWCPVVLLHWLFLHTISIMSFLLWWYMLGDGGCIWITRNLFREVHTGPNSF